MSSSNPLTDLRLLVATALTTNTPLLEKLGDGDAVRGLNNVQIHDRAVDIRGTLEESAASQRSVHMVPTGLDHQFDANDSFTLRVSYRVEVFHEGDAAEGAEEIAWLILQGLAYLYMNREVGGADALVMPEPFILLAIQPDDAEADREPGMEDTDQWTVAARIVAAVRVPVAALLTLND